jgi:hypothetical protein
MNFMGPRDGNRDEEEGREYKKPRGDPPRSTLEGEKLPLCSVLLQLYFKGNFGVPPCVFTEASNKSGQSSRPLRPDRELLKKIHNWTGSWWRGKCPFVRSIVSLWNIAELQEDDSGRNQWLLFIEALKRHLQVSQQEAQDRDGDDSSEY